MIEKINIMTIHELDNFERLYFMVKHDIESFKVKDIESKIETHRKELDCQVDVMAVDSFVNMDGN